MLIGSLYLILLLTMIHNSCQDCPEEISTTGLRVTWHRTYDDHYNVESNPICYMHGNSVKRNCTNGTWVPPLWKVPPCLKLVKYFDLSSCPPGYHNISDKNNEYCFQFSSPSPWNYPCFKSGAGSVITDLNIKDLGSLIHSLRAANISKYFWLPAQRPKRFNPIVWYTPGPKWGRRVDDDIPDSLLLQSSILKNCLLLDIEQGMIVTETCNKIYPSLCMFINDFHYPATCPDGYYAFRFMHDNGTCFGIERADQDLKSGLTFDNFIKSKCAKPMDDSKYDSELTRFTFKKIAELSELPDDTWCWFATSQNFTQKIRRNDEGNRTSEEPLPELQGVINNIGSLGLKKTLVTLPCMACEVEVAYGETQLMVEYDESKKQIYLTIYFPSGLWKYNFNDKGIQCFSDAKGFVKVIDVKEFPFFEVNPVYEKLNKKLIDKIVYIIELVTERSAQYWCEGHTKNFSLITTNKIIVNPRGNNVHVFALVIKVYFVANEDPNNMNVNNITTNLCNTFNAEKVLLMDIFDYTTSHMQILLHLHIAIDNVYEGKATNLQVTYNNLRTIAELEFPRYNYTFINMSSSIYCLPTISENSITLDWDITPIGHITVPRQFCLQSNGLPVTRHCYGSYLLGSTWGEVEGQCDKNFKPSPTTTFLYNFVKGEVPENYVSHFLTTGLGFVLDDVDIIIPADIYYLSMSLQHILNVFQENYTSVEMGDIDNIAWVVDRVMILDNSYLRLSQTLNSTNVILDSVNDIIEILAQKNSNVINHFNKSYQLAVKPKFMVQISYPKYNNISGIAIMKPADSDKFVDMIVIPLYANTTLDDVLSINNLQIATWLPEIVLNSLKKNTNDSEDIIDDKDIHVVINVFHNDAVFQELDANKYYVNSRIIGVTIPGYVTNLKYSIPLIFKDMNFDNKNKFCGYWDFQTPKTGSVPGFWANNGCYLVLSTNNLTVCECFHLTHFGQLITNYDEETLDAHHSKALNVITLVGSFLSLAGIIGIWTTALVFDIWRKKAGTKVLLHLSTAIALPLILVVVFSLDNTIFVEHQGVHTVARQMEIVCVVLGALLHYSILANFMWMLITAILQFIRYVQVLGVRRPSRFMIKFTLIGWGIPLIPVAIVLLINHENYIPDPSTNSTICYPSGYYFAFGVTLPICFILVINIILFAHVIYAISRGPEGKMRVTDISLVGAQLRLSIFLFFLMGLTWIFGVFSFSDNLVWSYLFCVTSTLQGFVLFIYFVVCDPTTRNLWVTLMKPQFRTTQSRNSISSLSSG